MRANSMCISCILSKQEKSIRGFQDEDKKSKYIHQVLEILHRYGETESSPCLAEKINELYENYWGDIEDYTEIKHKYNQLLLEKEDEIKQRIQNKEDVLKECIKYVCAGNYIDFSAVANVTVDTFESLLRKADKEVVLAEEFIRFQEDLKRAHNLVYLTDNCGEIVLDKIFIQFIKGIYPQLDITVIVRGNPVINDATMEDAREVGLTKLVSCIGNGNAAPGTVLNRLSQEAKQVLLDADVVISKGQGNFESLYGEGVNPYFLFLCKCDLFVQRFGLQKYQSVFAKEERIAQKIRG